MRGGEVMVGGHSDVDRGRDCRWGGEELLGEKNAHVDERR
jgi:hypothetical protein